MINKFYPGIEYHLYDPSGESEKRHERFDDGLRDQPNIKLYPQFFTDSDAEGWRQFKVDNPNVGLYFISDIRNRDVAPDPGGRLHRLLQQRRPCAQCGHDVS